MLGVAAIKAIVEDRKRHQEDRRTNSSTARVLAADGACAARWSAFLLDSGHILRRMRFIAAVNGCLLLWKSCTCGITSVMPSLSEIPLTPFFDDDTILGQAPPVMCGGAM